MVNYYDKHRFISKKELARLAGVSSRTFCRYLASRRHILDAMGVLPNARLLPPKAVKYICEDQQVTDKSPLYRHLIRELQMNTFFEGKWVRVTEIPHDF